jgi:hypothetical protein
MGADHGRIVRTSGAIGPTWAQYGPFMGPSWAQHGPTMGGSWALTWAHDGTIMCHRPSMAPLWAILGPSWAHHGPSMGWPIMDPRCADHGPITGPSWIIMGLSWAARGPWHIHIYIFLYIYICIHTCVYIYTCIWIHMYQKGPLWGGRVPCSLFMATSPYLYDGLKPFQ